MERMNSSSDDEPLHPGGAASDANTAMLKLASGSRTNYMRRYVSFMKWKKAKGVKSFSEEVLLHYFKELATAKLPSSLWAIYSMLKVTLSAKKNIQIAEYSNLTEFLKQQSRGFTSRKSKAFSASEVETFLKKAPDHNYLCVKVALIMVVNGACQFQEMIKLRVSDVQKHSDQLLLVNIMSSPTKVNRTFMILDKDVEIIEKYMALRPKRIKTDRFFIRYYLGKCSRQVIGKNNFQKYPRRIAEYLKLANPELYTGHCFRKTAARLRSNPETESQSRKKLEQSALEHSPGVTVKVEREENKVPFDFIDVQDQHGSSTEKSKERYIAAYDQFVKWRNEKNTISCSENVLLAYFEELANKYKPSSLWSTYSMLKPTLRAKNCINIKEYTKLSAFLKRQAEGYVCKKSKVLTGENVEKFINEAPDEKYLATKVALIFGVAGACRRQELSEITTNDIENHGDMLLIKIPHTKNKNPRSFVVHGKYYDIVKKYESLRTKKGSSNRFFQQFGNGKCTARVIGRNKFGNMPKEIAEYLNLPDSNSYTGHTFRRTSATLLADSRADNMT